MFDLSNNPALLPALGGGFGGAILVWLILSIKARFARLKAEANERLAAEKIDTLKSENSALETEIATLRTAEARFIKHQGELEAAVRSQKDRAEEMKKMAGAIDGTIKNSLEKGGESRAKQMKQLTGAIVETIKSSLEQGEAGILEAISRVVPVAPTEPAAPIIPDVPDPSVLELPDDDLDFVRVEDLPTSSDSGKTDPGKERNPFGGFAGEQTDLKAESAANALRAALEDKS